MRRPTKLVMVVMGLVVASCSSGETTATTQREDQNATTSAVATTVETMEAFEAVFEVTYVEVEGCTWEGPSKIPAGLHVFVLDDPTGELETLYIIRADEGRTLQDAIDHQPAPGKWIAKPDWLHYTADIGSGQPTDGGVEYTKLLSTPGPHVVLLSLYYDVSSPEERIHWYCSPSEITVVKAAD